MIYLLCAEDKADGKLSTWGCGLLRQLAIVGKAGLKDEQAHRIRRSGGARIGCSNYP